MTQMSGKSVLKRLREVTPTISVGILTADLLSLGTELAILDNAGVKLLHIDVMDGYFCPKMTFGPPLIKALKSSLFRDVHLMIQDPLEKLGDYVAAGADMITVHLESERNHIHRVLQALGTMSNANDSDRGLVRGVALNPGTPVEAVQPVIDEVDLILLLAVNPGWSGQTFISSTQRRLNRVSEIIRDSGRDILLGVDGGINRGNITEVARMGADIIVTGSAVFDGKRPAENARFMLSAVRDAKKDG
jgi:ribulose-phosphate 3-epimerase